MQILSSLSKNEKNSKQKQNISQNITITQKASLANRLASNIKINYEIKICGPIREYISKSLSVNTLNTIVFILLFVLHAIQFFTVLNATRAAGSAG
jgi:hypothetical protein